MAGDVRMKHNWTDGSFVMHFKGLPVKSQVEPSLNFSYIRTSDSYRTSIN